jgi:hypothetical protein
MVGRHSASGARQESYDGANPDGGYFVDNQQQLAYAPAVHLRRNDPCR